jgi:hypothetical protein
MRTAKQIVALRRVVNSLFINKTRKIAQKLKNTSFNSSTNMFFAFKYLLVIVACSLNFHFCFANSRQNLREDESTIKMRNRLEKLLEIGNRAPLRSYVETPESSLFPTIDVKNSFPGKFLNFSTYLQNIKNVWNESNLLENIKTNFIFANLTELVNGQELSSKTNLKRFLSSKGDYAYETVLQNRVPIYLK